MSFCKKNIVSFLGGLDEPFILGFEMDKTVPSEVWFVMVLTTFRILDFARGTGDLMPTMIHGDDTSGVNWMIWLLVLAGHR
jgi:hypothetical protein